VAEDEALEGIGHFDLAPDDVGDVLVVADARGIAARPVVAGAAALVNKDVLGIVEPVVL